MEQTIGQRLRRFRFDRDWTKLKLSEEADVPLATISLVERGKRRGDGLSVKTVRRLAQAFGITVDELIGDEEPAREARAPGRPRTPASEGRQRRGRVHPRHPSPLPAK
jgi:transcriptional regulator with XRE-family HTH domain